MSSKKQQRLRRARRTRIRIAEQGSVRVCVNRSNAHISASLVSSDGDKVMATASTQQADVKAALEGNGGGTTRAAAVVGKRIAGKAKELGLERVVFDRSGYAYHGRVKALAEAARESGLQF